MFHLFLLGLMGITVSGGFDFHHCIIVQWLCSILACIDFINMFVIKGSLPTWTAKEISEVSLVASKCCTLIIFQSRFAASLWNSTKPFTPSTSKGQKEHRCIAIGLIYLVGNLVRLMCTNFTKETVAMLVPYFNLRKEEVQTYHNHCQM